MKVSASLPTGVAALLFDGAVRRRRLENRLVERLEEAGFAEAILPVVDYLEPYEELLSEASREELYRFVDRDGEILALRADFTPMLARLLAPRLPSLDLPLRLFYRGDVLRYEEERAGKDRELYQLGAEILGRPGDESEKECLSLFLDLLSRGNRQQILVVVGFAGALDRLLLGAPEGLPAHEAASAVVRRERRVARQLDPAVLRILENGVPDDPSVLGERAAERLPRIRALCEELARRFPTVDLHVDLAEFADQALAPELRRAVGTRAYYDGLVFQAYCGAAAEPLGGGGRYDRLFASLGTPVTAAGFSISVDRLTGRGAR